MLNAISVWAIPIIVIAIPLYGYWRGVRIYDAFIEGATEGFTFGVKLIPYLVAMMTAIAVFRDSGALNLVTDALRPVVSVFGIPPEVIPLMIVRPLSGGGALGITAELLRTYGPDSYVGKLASIMQGSTDTTLYIITVYFGSVGIRRIRHSLAAGLIADFTGFVAAGAVCAYLFN